MLLRLSGQGNQELNAISPTSTGYRKLHFECESKEFDIHENKIHDVIRFDHIENVILDTILSGDKYVILDISDDELDELVSMCDYSRIETFQSLIHTLDNLRGEAEEATDYEIEDALETVMDAIDNNLDDIRQEFENMRSEMINDVKVSWSSHIYKFS